MLDGEKYNGKDAMAAELLNEDLQLSIFERVKKAKETMMIEKRRIRYENFTDLILFPLLAIFNLR